MTTSNIVSIRPIEVQVRDLIDKTIERFGRSNLSVADGQMTAASEQSAECSEPKFETMCSARN